MDSSPPSKRRRLDRSDADEAPPSPPPSSPPQPRLSPATPPPVEGTRIRTLDLSRAPPGPKSQRSILELFGRRVKPGFQPDRFIPNPVSPSSKFAFSHPYGHIESSASASSPSGETSSDAGAGTGSPTVSASALVAPFLSAQYPTTLSSHLRSPAPSEIRLYQPIPQTPPSLRSRSSASSHPRPSPSTPVRPRTSRTWGRAATAPTVGTAREPDIQSHDDIVAEATGLRLDRPVLDFDLPVPNALGGRPVHASFFESLAARLPSSSPRKRPPIPQSPERVLDAPNLMNDFYYNVLDWSSSGCLAVGLAETCYLWTDSTGQVDTLQSQRNRDDHISSCAFSVDGTKVAVGTLSGLCTIYDVTPGSGYMGKLFSCQQSYPVCAISWNRQGVVSLGDRSGKILNYNGKNSIGQWIQTFGGAHTDRVVGLRWCPQGRLLASGGNDNRVFLWEIGRSSPKLELAGHSAAVRAIAWCPWQYNLLATGGGLDDRCIRFWNTDTGTCVKKVHTGSQVCAVLWSKSYRELISAQYRDENQLILWSYPSMEQVGTMPGHKERPIHMALSPDGQTVVTAASDENLKFWKCFPIKPGQKLLEPPGKLVTADDPLTNSLR